MPGLKKIVIIGPESTGKSTLTNDLAARFNTVGNPEYAREHLEVLGRPYVADDLLSIADGQLQAEDRLAAEANRFLFCDTDLYVVKVWSEARFGACHRAILEAIALRNYDLYLLTGIDMPWQPDPLREHPDPRDRQYFYHQYRDIVQQSGVPWVAVHGSAAERLAIASDAVSRLA